MPGSVDPNARITPPATPPQPLSSTPRVDVDEATGTCFVVADPPQMTLAPASAVRHALFPQQISLMGALQYEAMLADPNPVVVVSALDQLLKMDSADVALGTGPVRQSLAESLLFMVSEYFTSNPTLRDLAFRASIKVGDATLLHDAIAMITDPKQPESLRVAAIDAASRRFAISPTEAAQGEVAELVKAILAECVNEDPSIQEAASQSLSRLGQQGREVLVSEITADLGIRPHLKRWLELLKPLGDEAVEILAAVPWREASSIGQELVVRMLVDRGAVASGELEAAIANGIVSIPLFKATPALLEKLLRSETPKVREFVASYMRKEIDSREVDMVRAVAMAQMLAEFLGDANASVVSDAAHVIDRVVAKNGTSLLVVALVNDIEAAQPHVGNILTGDWTHTEEEQARLWKRAEAGLQHLGVRALPFVHEQLADMAARGQVDAVQRLSPLVEDLMVDHLTGMFHAISVMDMRSPEVVAIAVASMRKLTIPQLKNSILEGDATHALLASRALSEMGMAGSRALTELWQMPELPQILRSHLEKSRVIATANAVRAMAARPTREGLSPKDHEHRWDLSELRVR